jgi:hypothetical protein
MSLESGASNPADPKPRKRVAVRSNRRRCSWVAAVGLPLWILFILIDPESPNDDLAEWLLMAASLAAFYPGVQAAAVLFSSHRYLVFDPATRKLTTGPGNWRQRSVFPRRGFDRIEYSIYNAQIYQVRAIGRRRRILIPRWLLNRQDWRDFVDALTDTSQISSPKNEKPLWPPKPAHESSRSGTTAPPEPGSRSSDRRCCLLS